MKNIEILNKSEVYDAVSHLGDFVCVLKNGTIIDEVDLKNPCGCCDVECLFSAIDNTDIQQISRVENKINIVTDDGDILEFQKSLRHYLTRKDAADILNAFLKKYRVLKMEDYIVESKGNRILSVDNITIDNALKEVNEYFETSNFHCQEKDFIVKDSELHFMIGWEESGQDCCNAHYKKIFGQTMVAKDTRINNKIIQSYKFKEHMKVHRNDFIIPYYNIINYAVRNGYFDNLNTNFTAMVVEFPFDIGYSSLCKISANDTIVYAKRINRDIYSKFTLDGSKKLTNKCVFVLNRNRNNPNEYYLVTMFAGEFAIKEPYDTNIKSEEELRKVIEFWDEHALVFNPKDVNLETAIYTCPYEIGA